MKTLIYNFTMLLYLKKLTEHCELRKLVNCIMLTVIVSASLYAQENTQGRVPVYPVTYEYPTVDGIIADSSIRESTSHYR